MGDDTGEPAIPHFGDASPKVREAAVDMLSASPLSGLTADMQATRQTSPGMTVPALAGFPAAPSAEGEVGSPPPRLLDSDPSKFRSLKRVIVLGPFGSGTDGIGDALKRLGFKVYDFQAASTRYERDFPLWVEAAFLRHEGRPYNKSDFDKLIGNHDAVVGVPTSFFYEEFVKLYPNVKVIFVTRDPDPDLIETFVQRITSKFWQRLDTVYYRNIDRLLKLNAKSDNYLCLKDDKIVRENVRERNLLEVHNLIAWVPLCEFLGVKVPADAPAPELHNNTTKAEFAAHPWRAASSIAKRAGIRTVMSLTYILTMASVAFVSAMAAVLGGAGLHQLFFTSIHLFHLLAVRSQIRDTTRLAAAGLALLTFVCGIGAGYAIALMRIPEPVVLESSPGDHKYRNNSGRRRGGGRGRGRQQENDENKRPERPTLNEWSGVQENIRRDDAEMVKEDRSTFEEWKKGKHVTFHVTHKRTENGQDLYSRPRKVLSITEETVE